MKYEPADDSVKLLAEAIIERHYPELYELLTHESPTQSALKIDYLYVHPDLDEDGQPIGPAIKHQGYPAAGLCRIINLRDRAMGRGDVEIQLDYHQWGEMDGDAKEALLAHEIHHITPKVDRSEIVMRDDLGRVKITMRKHDYQFGWFTTIARRYGLASGEVRQAKAMIDDHGQVLFPFLHLETPTRLAASRSGEGVTLYENGKAVQCRDSKEVADRIIEGARKAFSKG